jgi:hypothetical protein
MGTPMRLTYDLDELRPATVEHGFRWSYVDAAPAAPRGWDEIEA